MNISIKSHYCTDLYDNDFFNQSTLFVKFWKVIIIKKLLYIFTLLTLLILLVGCNNANPILNNSNSKNELSQNSSQTGEKIIPTYINADALAKRSYEIRYLFAQKEFKTPDEISVNALVQYAFCHLYYEDLISMPNEGAVLQYANFEQIMGEITKSFGNVSTDITTADLYNKGSKQFEMWQPHYNTEIFYDVKLSVVGNNQYKAYTIFYTDFSKSKIKGKTFLTVEDVGGKIYIKKLASSD